MEGTKHIFIINPAAGKSDQTLTAASSIGTAAKSRGLDYEIHITEYPRHACLLVRTAIEQYAGQPLRFYACGGDGTLNEVASAAAGVPNVSFTHYAMGSGNDFVKIFGSDVPRFSSIDQLLDGESHCLDYIESDCGIALNILSVGVDARIAAGMQKYKRLPMLSGHSAYMAATVEHVIRGLHRPYKVEVDGVRYDGRYTLIMAANGQFYGGGFWPVPDADPTDGLMDVLLIRDISRLTAAKVIGAFKAGKYRELPQYITHMRAKELTVYSGRGEKMEVNLDGEMEYVSRVSMRIAAGGAQFVAPAGVWSKPAEVN